MSDPAPDVTRLLHDETAEVLEVSHATVERDLKLAKAWLARQLSDDG